MRTYSLFPNIKLSKFITEKECSTLITAFKIKFFRMVYQRVKGELLLLDGLFLTDKSAFHQLRRVLGHFICCNRFIDKNTPRRKLNNITSRSRCYLFFFPPSSRPTLRLPLICVTFLSHNWARISRVLLGTSASCIFKWINLFLSTERWIEQSMPAIVSASNVALTKYRFPKLTLKRMRTGLV